MWIRRLMLAAVAAVAVCSLVTGAWAVDSEFEVATPVSALEFQVGPDFDLSSFDGTMISWKRLTSSNRGWRFGVSPLLSHWQSNEPPEPYAQQIEEERYVLSVNAQRLFLSKMNNRTRGYWGLGPQAGLNYFEERRSWADSSSTVVEERVTIRREWTLGVSAVVGVEYFFLPTMSLLAEYGADISYRRTSGTNRRVYKVLEFNSNSTRLGLSVLF